MPTDGHDGEGDYWDLVQKAQTIVPAAVGDVDMEASRLVMSLNRAMRVVIYDLEVQTLKPLGVTDSAFRLLFVLWTSGSLSPHRLARLSGMPRPTVSSLTSALRKAGLVERRGDPADGRAAMLELTKQGEDVISEAFLAHNRREAEWASVLTPIERSLLTMLLEKLMAGRQGIGAVERS
ncbi:MarR family winged helix-turn-helix transcriptional regulator [Arthrobacter koreensis]|uniref:MarR family winged helix-turn-helix transcriptional regulator n=1 Tax=Arthrobacter koreensis TaxID=199136 RepID=UPI003AD4031D